MWDQYYCAGSLDEVLDLLKQYRSRARIIAGGTDLLLEMMHGKRPDVDVLIDVTRVPGLNAIRQEGDRLVLGALVTHNQAAGSDLIRQYAPPLAQASWEVGAPQIRNRATIAGNLITASAANDTITALVALRAEITLRSAAGERVIPIEAFFTGLRQTVLQPDEMLTAIAIPMMTARQRGVFLKLGLRRAQAISVVNVAAVVEYDAHDLVAGAVIALGSVAPTIIRVPAAEALLIGKHLDEATIREAAQAAEQTPKPITDIRSTAEYRTEMVRVLVARALRAVRLDGTGAVLPQHPAMLTDNLFGEVPANPIGQADALIECTINGKQVSIASGRNKTLLHWLREDAGLPGTKEGCAEGECGACTVLMDGAAVMSCLVPAPRAHGSTIVTIEGVGREGRLHPVQESFIEHGAVQCGYCTPGFIVSGVQLLNEHPNPTREQVEQAFSGNLCRCTGYAKIIEAMAYASDKNSQNEEK